MTTMRSYDDGCGAAHGMELIGERWALLVVRELVLGPKRFTDLRSSLPKLSPNVLVQRLRELEESGIVRHRKLPPPAASQVYELTEWGRELEPIIMSLGRWASRSPSKPSGPLSLSSMVLAMRTMFSAEAAGDFNAVLRLHLAEQDFTATVRNGAFDVKAGEPPNVDASIFCEPQGLQALVFGGRSLREAIKAADVRVEGDRAAVERFLTLFPLPVPVSSGA